MDETVRELAGHVEGRVSLLALGGYGRRELCPASDVDVMILHDERRPDDVRLLADRLFYALWDAGLDLGHAVRTVGESATLARERPDTMTSMLDARLIAGDGRLLADLDRELDRGIREDSGSFARALLEANEERHSAHGSCSALLEPNLKEGSGGLRDLHSLGWLVRALPGSAPGDRERAALEDAWEFLLRLRSALHLETGRRTDRLFLDHQPDLARAFGFEATAGLAATDALMRSLFEHARQVEHVVGRVFRRALASPATRVPSVEAPKAPASAEEGMRALAEAASSGAMLEPELLERIADTFPSPVPWADGIRRDFLRILASGKRGEEVLEALDRVGGLVRLLPEWEAVRCRPQRDPYHRWSVDVHLLKTVARTAEMLAGETGEDPVLAEAAAAVPDRDAVLLGALLHDIGKRGEGRHVQVGERVSARVLQRMGVPGPTRDHALFLVREHLLLSDTAARRDLGDENLVLDVAARAGDPGRLAMLVVLTAVDSESTGPLASSLWRRALVRELTGKVQHALERGERDRIRELGERLDLVARSLEDEDPDAVAEYLERLPRPYLLAVAPEAAARHFRLLGPPLASGEVRTEVRRRAREEAYDLTVVARDRPGLLAMIAGCLSLGGLNILSAQAFTTEDGTAVDLFVVEGAFEREVDEGRWRRIRADLRHALDGRMSLDHRVREKRRHYPAPASVPTRVTFHDDASDFYTVVEVSAADRIGLLFDLASVFRDLGLDVHLAKVATLGERVVDAFYVRDLAGRKLEATMAGEIEHGISARLSDAG